MIHMTKQLDLTESPLRIDLVIERIRYLLNRHVLARLRIQSRATKPQNSDSKTQTQKENQRNQREREREKYQTMPYAPFPIGIMGGLYLAVTSKMLPKMLY
jgi:hypothetical protein